MAFCENYPFLFWGFAERLFRIIKDAFSYRFVGVGSKSGKVGNKSIEVGSKSMEVGNKFRNERTSKIFC